MPKSNESELQIKDVSRKNINGRPLWAMHTFKQLTCNNLLNLQEKVAVFVPTLQARTWKHRWYEHNAQGHTSSKR